jgi:Protein of unknown function (DUF1329)
MTRNWGLRKDWGVLSQHSITLAAKEEYSMSKRTRSLLSGIAAMVLVSVLACAARAEMLFDPQHYRDLVDASSSQTIPPGTRITLQNWRQYKNFMPLWMQASYSGDYHWHIGSGPEFTVVVGPTTSFPLPKKYLDDTEKFKGQVRLEKTSWGGYTIKGYTAGVPFPNPTEPDKAAKLMYNGWLPFRPAVSRYYSWDKIVDKYGNVSPEDTDNSFYTMAYLSDDGYPNQTAGGTDFFQAGRYFIAAPEQSKYTTELQLQPKDPTRLQELYVFLPSLRRSLRLSSAARCTPLLGTDYIADDGSWLPPNFSPTFLGEKKVLVVFMDPAKSYEAKSYAGGGAYPGDAFPGWPVAGTGLWQLRDVYVIDMLALPILGNYCYSHRILYIDKENWVTAAGGGENYDRTGKLYKMLWTAQFPINFHGVMTTYAYSTGMSMAMDFQNQHVTWNNDSPVQIDDQVPPDIRDPANATPASLDRVMK